MNGMSAHGLVLLPGMQGSHNSASARKTAALEARCDHLMTVIAVLVVQSGGLAVVPALSLTRAYNLGVRLAPDAIYYSSTPRPPDDDAAADNGDATKEPT